MKSHEVTEDEQVRVSRITVVVIGILAIGLGILAAEQNIAFLVALAFAVAGLVIYWSGWNIVWRLGLAILLGYLLMAISAWDSAVKGRPNAPKPDWRAAQWLPVYLIGMGVISWQGTFGTGAAGNLPLWWDIAVIVVFSLVIYYWALAVALPTAEIERNIADVEVVDEGGH